MASPATDKGSAPIYVLMGVSGSGKTTIGSLLARQLGLVFADADDYHTVANKQKMAAGQALSDADRQPWLEALNRQLQQWDGAAQGGVLACSALKESYRVTLAAGVSPERIHWVLLMPSREVIAARLAARHHEYMNPALLDSQLATLERPGQDEAVHIENAGTPAEAVAQILSRTQARTQTQTQIHTQTQAQ